MRSHNGETLCQRCPAWHCRTARGAPLTRGPMCGISCDGSIETISRKTKGALRNKKTSIRMRDHANLKNKTMRFIIKRLGCHCDISPFRAEMGKNNISCDFFGGEAHVVPAALYVQTVVFRVYGLCFAFFCGCFRLSVFLSRSFALWYNCGQLQNGDCPIRSFSLVVALRACQAIVLSFFLPRIGEEPWLAASLAASPAPHLSVVCLAACSRRTGTHTNEFAQLFRLNLKTGGGAGSSLSWAMLCGLHQY